MIREFSSRLGGRLALSLAFAASLFILGAQRAHATSLLELLEGASISALSMDFTDWSLARTTLEDSDLSAIDVTPLEDQPLNPGLLFTANGRLATDPSNTLVGLDFQFTATSTRGPIQGNTLRLIAHLVDNLALLAITETVNAAGVELAEKVVFAVGFGDMDQQLVDVQDFVPQQSILIEKQISLLNIGAEPGNVARIEEFSQRFSQIPEPTALSLMAIGLLSFYYFRKKRITKRTPPA